MQLSVSILQQINSNLVSKPEAKILHLPEKVLQFGTGVLLRGLPGYYIDRANKAGLFNGRIVMVKSTSGGDTEAYAQQDGLYTHCLKGIEDGKPVEEYIINASISRVLTAAEEWQQVLDCAVNPAMEIIVSNTTEVGLVLHPGDKITGTPPLSFPGKLLAFLHHRYTFFKGDADKGMVVLPTELITSNGDLLKQIVQQLAKENELEDAFVQWLTTANHFCNTLVDRIVPGKLPAAQQENTEALLGYSDELMIMSETYGLWAIETTSGKVREKLSFAATGNLGDGCMITDDIHLFRELKIRLLNGTHTFNCAQALMAGFATVKEAINDEAFSNFTTQLMLEEIVPSITSAAISHQAAVDFALSVLNRFRNPYIEHNWLSITLNYTQKMQLRCIPLIVAYYRQTKNIPKRMAQRFAAYLVYLQSSKEENGNYYTEYRHNPILLQDEAAAYFYNCRKQSSSIEQLVDTVLGNISLWSEDLGQLPGFTEMVTAHAVALARGAGKDIFFNEVQTIVQGAE
jgi:tagaturonate reductase